MPLTRLFVLSPLERRVFFVALASLVPVAILSALLLVLNAREQERRLYRGTEDTVLALINAVDAELKSNLAALDALVVSPRLARGDFARLREEALQLLARRPSWLNLIVSDSRKVGIMTDRASWAAGADNFGADSIIGNDYPIAAPSI